MNLKKIWRLRFQGWQWLFLPVLMGFSMALFAMVTGMIQPPSPPELLLTFAIVILTLILNLIAIWEIGTPISRMADAVRGINQKRMESRANFKETGVTGELAEQINRMVSRLLQEQDQIDSMVLQRSQRLHRDHEELQARHQELRRSLAEALKTVETQTELFSHLSHELRTPLTAILGYGALLRRTALDTEQQAHLDTVTQSAQGMLDMINNLLDWGRLEAGRMQLNDEIIDLHQIVEDSIALLAPLAYRKQLELASMVYADVPARIRGDAQRMRQILINLLSNAIKFTQQGDVQLRVMRDRASDGRVWISLGVTDTGPGIAPEQQKRLFQAFQQTTGTQSGSGLGLSITRKLTELMGGRVDMQSQPGHGSTFGVVIPFRLVEDSAPAEAPYTPLRGLEIWVLEPHPLARQRLLHQLEQWQLAARSFDTIPALQTALAQGRPAAVIVGLRVTDLPHAGTRALLRACAGTRPPLLALVASADPDIHAQLRQMGAADVQSKSIGRLALLRRLTLLLSAGDAAEPLAGQRALVVDNNLVNRRYIAALCGDLGLRVEEAADGQDALDRFRRNGADLVLLDAKMPGLSGLECIRRLRALPTPRRPRLIVCSAHLEPREREAFLREGADGILLKPFDGADLLRMAAPELPAATPPSKTLTEDPELLDLLREELPVQLRELETALAASDLDAARAAAHQLRGTASFYHMEALKQAADAMEERLLALSSLDGSTGWRKTLQTLQAALRRSLETLALS